MYIQGVENVYDLKWNENVTYGDVWHANEVEQSVYNFELADTDMLFKLFDMYEAEAKRVCEAGYVLPAYDYVLNVPTHSTCLIPVALFLSVNVLLSSAAYVH